MLDYINEYIDNTCNQKFMKEAMRDKVRIKKAIGRNEKLLPECKYNKLRLKDVI